MDEILKELDTVFRLVSSIPVVGNDVDTMAAVRVKLRKVYADLGNHVIDSDVKCEVSQQ